MAKALKIAAVVVGVAALAVVTGGAALGLGVSLATTAFGVSAGTLLLASTALSLGSALLTKKPGVTAAQTERLFASVDPRAFRKTPLGQTAFPIDIGYEEWSGKDQEYCDWIVRFASCAIDGVEEIWFNTEMAWSAQTGVVGKYAGYFSVPNIVLEGGPGNAFTFGSGKWNAFSARLTGCAYARFRFKVTGNGKKAESPFASGLPSRITVIGRGAKLYDPRRDSTVAGGSGPMRVDDQSTWRFTADDGVVIGENLPLQILRVVLGWRIRNPETGEMRLATGSGVPGRRLRLASWIDAANLADELVNRSAGGQEPRYHGAAVVSEGDEPRQTLDMLSAGCCGRFRDTGGKLSFEIMHNDLAAAATDDGLFDDDVIGGFTWDPDPGLEATPNIVRGRYVDASINSLYQLIDYPEVRVASADGQDRIYTLDLGAVESASQAQRVVKQGLQRKQYQRRFSAPFDIRAWKYQVGSVVPFTFAPLGFTRALFRVEAQELGQGGVCNMTLTAEHASIYAFDADDRLPVQAAEPIVYDSLNNPLIVAIREAQDELDAIGSDAVLAKGEKDRVIQKYREILSNVSALYNRFVALGQPAEIKAAMDAAIAARDALSAYLETLVPRWDDQSRNTSIDPLAWRDRWNAAIDALAIAAAAFTSATGQPGANAPLVLTQWSIDGVSNWHDNYFGADRYYRQSNDGGVTYGPAILGVGEDGADGARGADGGYEDSRFRYSSTVPATPAGVAPAEWYDAPTVTQIAGRVSTSRDDYISGDQWLRVQPGEVYRIIGGLNAAQANAAGALGLNFAGNPADGTTFGWNAAGSVPAGQAGAIDGYIVVPPYATYMRPWAQIDAVEAFGQIDYHYRIDSLPPLFVSRAKRNADNSLASAWSAPVRISGADGKEALTAFLTNETFSHPTDANGAPTAITSGVGDGQMKVLLGSRDITSLCTFTAQQPYWLGVTVDAAGNYSANYLGNDNGYAFIIAVFQGRAIAKQLNATRSKAGTDGTSPPLVTLTASDQSFSLDTSGAARAKTIRLTARVQNSAAGVVWGLNAGDGRSLTNWVDAATLAAVGAATRRIDDFTVEIEATKYHDILATHGGESLTYLVRIDGTEVRDTVSIVRVRDGAPGRDGIPGTNGSNGQPGRDGRDGADGQTSYPHYAYADSDNGHVNFTTGAAEGRSFVGVYVDFFEPDSDNPDSYRWTRLRGLDGNNGLPGKAGSDGRTPYVHTAYANSPDGSVDFTTDDAQALARRYIGLRTDYEVADLQDPAGYVWSLSRGADGVSPFALELGSAAIVLNATYAGVTKPGQLPRNVAVSVKQGTTDAIGAVAIGISTSQGIAASYAGGVVSITTADADGYVEVSALQGGVNVVAPKRISISRSLDAPPPQTATGVTQRGYNGDPNNTSYFASPSGKIVTVAVPANGSLPIEIYLEYSVLENQSFAFRTYAAAAKIMYRPVGSGGAWSDLISEVTGTIASWSRSTQEYTQGELNYPSSVSLPGGQTFEFALMVRKQSGNGSAQYVDGFMRIGE